jgi:hypothetical protein
MQTRLAALVVVAALAGCGGHAGPRLAVGPATSLVDHPVSIEVSGVRPGTLVRVTSPEPGSLADADGRGRPERACHRRSGKNGPRPGSARFRQTSDPHHHGGFRVARRR